MTDSPSAPPTTTTGAGARAGAGAGVAFGSGPIPAPSPAPAPSPLPARRSPLAVMVAPTGARRGPADHPALPVTLPEIVRTAAACHEAGARMLHLHVRDRAGRHLLDAEAYGEATAAIRRAVGRDLVIQITTEAVGRYSPAEQRAVTLAVGPEAVSLALREMVPDSVEEAAAAAFYGTLHRQGVMVQHILYAPDEVARLRSLRARGIIPGRRVDVLFVLGRYTRDQAPKPCDLLPFLAAFPEGLRPHSDDSWMVCAFNGAEPGAAAVAAGLGGHVRIGFENNLNRPDGQPATDNADLVARAVAQGRAVGRPLATADQIRTLMAAY